ncbi:MAG TPA: cytochrome c nitrite reductase small subunit [Vicinamibacterales bacterium]|nr:cytochrome c nitrite reductase small subunit [Vicinamibacterales bacterium]
MTRRATLLATLGLVVGAAVGLGAYTFIYAQGGSYLTNDPAACMNCHVMREQYDGWVTSSHRAVAVCNDCHTPPGPVAKYVTKAQNGFWHSFAFTTGRFPDEIQITARNHGVTEQACRKCHEVVVQQIDAAHPSKSEKDELSCVQCHRSVGHID